MLQGQADRQAFAFRINTFALIDVKEPQVLQHRTGLLADILQQITGLLGSLFLLDMQAYMVDDNHLYD